MLFEAEENFMKILVVDDSMFSQKTTIKTLKSIYPDAIYETANDGLNVFKYLQPSNLTSYSWIC